MSDRRKDRTGGLVRAGDLPLLQGIAGELQSAPPAERSRALMPDLVESEMIRPEDLAYSPARSTWRGWSALLTFFRFRNGITRLAVGLQVFWAVLQIDAVLLQKRADLDLRRVTEYAAKLRGGEPALAVEF